MLSKIIKNSKFIKLFLLFSFIISWLSISTSYNDLLIFNDKSNLNLKTLINFFRHGLVYFCLFFLTICSIIMYEKIAFKNYQIFNFFAAYFLIQIPGLFFSDNSFENISFIVSALTIILTLFLINNFFDFKEKKIILIISFVILIIVFLITFIPLFWKFLNGGSIFYGVHTNSIVFLDKYSPRSSGLARTALILLLFIEIFEINLKKYSNKLIFIKIIFLSFILLFQSRTIIFLTLIVLLMLFFHKNTISIKNILRYILVYFILPMLLFIFLSTINSHLKKKKEFLNENNSYLNHISSEDLKIFRSIPKNDVSSGRFKDWKKIYNYHSGMINAEIKYLYFGYGSQGDRFLINQSASNGLIYALVSSGILGLILYATFSILVGIKSIKLLLYSYKNDNENFLYCLILMVLALRSILETSYAVFSIDLILFLIALSFINHFKINFKDIRTKYIK